MVQHECKRQPKKCALAAPFFHIVYCCCAADLRLPKEVRFSFAEEQRGAFPMDRLCQVMKLSPCGLRASIAIADRMPFGIQANLCASTMPAEFN